MTERKLADLEMECRRHGLTPTNVKGRKKLTKFDYIKALERYWLEQYRQRGESSRGIEWIHKNLQAPMLALSQTALTPNEFDQVLNSEDYCADTKLDGCRCLAYFHPDEGFSFFGRNRSVADFLFVNYSNQVLGLSQQETVGMFKKPFVLDCEITSKVQSMPGSGLIGETQLQLVCEMLALEKDRSLKIQEDYGDPLVLNVFDLLMFNDQNLFELPLKKRLEYLDKLLPQVQAIAGPKFQPVKRVFGGKKVKIDFFNEITAAGGEGSIMKLLSSTYTNTEGSRGGHGYHPWVKFKRTVSDSIGGDVDCWIFDYELGGEGTENAGHVSVLKCKVLLQPSGVEHHIGSVSNFPREFMRSLEEIDPSTGEMTLKKEVYGKVITIDGQDVSSKSKRFTHCKIVNPELGFRIDKSWMDCTFEESDLEALVL